MTTRRVVKRVGLTTSQRAEADQLFREVLGTVPSSKLLEQAASLRERTTHHKPHTAFGEDFAREAVECAKGLMAHGWFRSDAAKAIGVTSSTLWVWLKGDR